MSSFAPAAAYYDLLYAHIRDYAADTRALLALFAEVEPPVRRVLDVACGTGVQAALLAAEGLHVDGVDLEPEFVRRAAARVPSGAFRVADMRDFDVPEPYDVVTCLFGSVGYTRDEAELRASVANLARAVRPGGLVVIEPWFEPGVMTDGYVTSVRGEGDGVHVVRMSRCVLRGDVSRLEFEYLVGHADGLTRLSEVHELTLFPRAVVRDAFAAAGLEPSYDAEGLMGRGLHLGQKPCA